VSYCPLQNYNCDDRLFYDFERVDFGDKPLENEVFRSVIQEYESFHIGNHSWDIDHWNLYGDHIYDSNIDFF